MKKSRKLLFTALMIFLVIISIEGMARLTYFKMYKRSYNIADLYNFIKHSNYEFTDEFAQWWDEEIIHPYLGFVIDFKNDKKNKETYGFFTTAPPVIKREPGKLNVVILGGSVANSMGKPLEAAFTRVCRVHPNVINLGQGGYKQPQQLLALAYFLSLGAEYDLVINLDGYNEIVLPVSDNYGVGVNPFFPRNWNLRINRQPSKKVLAAIGKVRYLRDLKEENLAGLPSSPYRWSAIYGIIKMQQFKKLNWDINLLTYDLIKLQQQEVKRFEETGPFFKYDNILQLYEEAAEVWVRGSVLMDRLARANGMAYYHFLQPNQYVEGSKELSAEEKQNAYMPNASYSEPAIIGYPILIKHGKNELAKQVNFFDATMVFAKEKQTIYIDTCCHYNERGKEILADFIMAKIAQNPKIRKFFKNNPPAAAAPKP